MQVESRGFTIDYAVDGDGPPLALIAGTLCAARHWVEYGYAAALARHWRVINTIRWVTAPAIHRTTPIATGPQG